MAEGAVLVEFRVSNHRSIREEQIFTTEASSSSKLASSSQSRKVQGHNKHLLPVAAIYGANGSGKSNLLDALAFMQRAVIHSHVHWEAGAEIPRHAFAWDDWLQRDSLLEVTLVAEGVRYVYGFVFDDNVFKEEWLYAYPKGYRQVWFERELKDKEYQYKYGDLFHGKNKFIESLTRPNALFLSVAAQNKHQLISPVYEWFWDIKTLSISHQRHSVARVGYKSALKSDPSLARAFLLLLQAADLGIASYELDDSKSVNPSLTIPRDEGVKIFHQGGPDRWLPLSEESSGTQTLFKNGVVFLQALKKSSVLLVDELENDLHPLIAAGIVLLFQSIHSNPNLAQLIFSTHDTNLLGVRFSGDASLLSRDQIWLTEKNQEGATSLYPLTEFHPRKAENLERGYLAGRYGAIPFLGDLEHLPIFD